MTRINRFSIIVLVSFIALFFVLMKINGFTYKDLLAQLVGIKPEITNVLVTNVTQKEATVYWKTDIKSSTELLYGITKENLNQTITLDTPALQNGVFIHKISMTNLTPCTRYYYRPKSTSVDGLATISGLRGFDTHGCGQSSGDITPPSAPTGVTVSEITSNSVRISWNYIDSPEIFGYAVFGPRNSTNDGRYFYVKSKNTTSTIITGLTPGTLYSGEYGQNGIDAGFMVQAIDTSDNYSQPSTRVSFTTLGGVSTNTCQSLLTTGTNFSSKLNPTGNPIGGGECYTNIIDKASANYVVSTKEALKQALLTATSGQIVYVEDNASIDMTGEKNVVIPGGAILASGRGKNGSTGGLIYSNSYFPESDNAALFVTGGPNVRITGLRLRGPNPDILDHSYAAVTGGVANGIRTLHSGLIVDNNELYAWDKWAIWLYIIKDAYIHHNYFHENMREGYGYSVWAGGSGSEVGANAIIEANLFKACRHCVASSGHDNSWIARHNVIMKRQLYINSDRHNKSGIEGQVGGRSTTLFRNLFFSTQKHFGFANPISSSGLVSIKENWFKRIDLCKSGTIGTIEACNPLSTTQVSITDNLFNGSGVSLPVAIITSNTINGVAPLAVNLSASATSPLSNQITRYEWHFGNGDAYGDKKYGKDVSYTFTQPGIYQVGVVAYDAYGIPSETAWKTVTVRPNSEGYILSAWVKDSYIGTLAERYKKQILINDMVVWEDDVAGNEAWQHVVVDISSKVTAGTEAKVAFRLYSKNGVATPLTDIVELTTFLDDITIFNTNLSNSSFEGEVVLPWKQKFYIPPGSINPTGSGTTTSDARSGDISWRFEFGYKKPVTAGIYGELYQTFTPN